MTNDNTYKYRACASGSHMGYFKTVKAAMRAMTVKKIHEVGGTGADGFIDERDANEYEGWRCIKHRVTMPRDMAGWYDND